MREIEGGAFERRSRNERANRVPIGKRSQNQRSDCEDINIDGEGVLVSLCQLLGIDGVDRVKKRGAEAG